MEDDIINWIEIKGCLIKMDSIIDCRICQPKNIEIYLDNEQLARLNYNDTEKRDDAFEGTMKLLRLNKAMY
jgi:hypothetical protein